MAMNRADPLDEAAAATQARHAEARPEVVALGVDRIRAQVDTCAWLAIGLGLAFTTVNVATFAANGAEPWSAAWLVAWLLDPMVSLLLIGVLRAEQVTSRWQVRTGARVTAVKWSAFAATYAMNTWASWMAATPKEVVLHSIPPVVVLLGSEVAPELRDRLTAVALLAEASTPTVAEPATQDRDDMAGSGSEPLDEDPPGERSVDPRVHELAELIADGCQVTAAQASLLHGCSTRTGRRLLAGARALAVRPRERATDEGRALPGLTHGSRLRLASDSTGALR